jgi:DNA-binding response OmpR family regulator
VLFLFDNFALDTDRRELRRGAVTVPVEPQVFDLVAYLIENRERVVSKDALIAAIWGGRIVSESALTTRINAARCAIGDSGAEQRLIKTLAWISQTFVTLRRAEASASVIFAVTKSKCDGIGKALARGSRIASPWAAASRYASR